MQTLAKEEKISQRNYTHSIQHMAMARQRYRSGFLNTENYIFVVVALNRNLRFK